MTHAADSFDHMFVAHFEARALGLVAEATTDEPRRLRDACLRLGTMMYDAERATRHKDNCNESEGVLYDASRAALRVVDVFIDSATEDQLRFALEGMVHGLKVDSILGNLHEHCNSPVGGIDEADGEGEVVRDELSAGWPPSASVMADVAADFTQTFDAETRVRAGVFVGMCKHQVEQSLRASDHDDVDHCHVAVEASGTVADIGVLIAQADANRLRAIIAGFRISTNM